MCNATIKVTRQTILELTIYVEVTVSFNKSCNNKGNNEILIIVIRSVLIKKNTC